jgi:hypothetical protein
MDRSEMHWNIREDVPAPVTVTVAKIGVYPTLATHAVHAI